MAHRRLSKRGPAPCPACDASLEPALSEEADPTCPHCGSLLQPVTVAGLWRRAAASCVDLAILGLTAVPLNLGLLALVSPAPVVIASTPMGALLEVLGASPGTLFGRALPAIFMAYLYMVLFWATSGSTPGSRLLGLRVVNSRCDRMGLGAAMLRAAIHALGLLPGALGSVWMAFDLEKRAWHDKVAGTYVIRTAPRGAA